MAITLLTAGQISAETQTNNISKFFTTVSGANNCLVVALGFPGAALGTQTITNPQWHGVAMTLVGSCDHNSTDTALFVYILANADVGALSFTATASNSTPFHIGFAQFGGVNQSTPYNAANVIQIGRVASTTTSDNITVSANNMAVDALQLNPSAGTPTVSGSNTQTVTSSTLMGMSYLLNGGTMSWANGTNDYNSHVVLELISASGGGASKKAAFVRSMMMGD